MKIKTSTTLFFYYFCSAGDHQTTFQAVGSAASEVTVPVAKSVEVAESVGETVSESVKVSTMVEFGSNVGIGTTGEKLLYV